MNSLDESSTSFTASFSYSRWSNYGTLIYGLLFPLLFVVWFLVKPPIIVHGEWGVALLVVYYAYQLGMVWYCLIKTPLAIVISEKQITFTFLGGRSVSWGKGEIGEIESKKNPLALFADQEIVITRIDGQSPMLIRPEVKGGKTALLHAFRQIGATVREKGPKGWSTDG